MPHLTRFLLANAVLLMPRSSGTADNGGAAADVPQPLSLEERFAKLEADAADAKAAGAENARKLEGLERNNAELLAGNERLSAELAAAKTTPAPTIDPRAAPAAHAGPASAPPPDELEFAVNDRVQLVPPQKGILGVDCSILRIEVTPAMAPESMPKGTIVAAKRAPRFFDENPMIEVDFDNHGRGEVDVRRLRFVDGFTRAEAGPPVFDPSVIRYG